MFSGHERCFGNLKVRGHRRDYRHCVKLRVSQESQVIAGGLGGGITTTHGGQTRLVQVTNPAKLRPFVLSEVSQKIWTPIAAPDHSNCCSGHRLERITVIRRKVNCGSRRTTEPWDR